MSWSPELKTFVGSAWAEGLSASQIVRVLRDKYGVAKSRSAVIGIVHRLGLHRPEAARVDIDRPCVNSSDHRVIKRVLLEKQAQITLKPVPVEPVLVGIDMGATEGDRTAIVLVVPPLNDRGVSIMALGDGMCRFIIDDSGPEALFCGLPVPDLVGSVLGRRRKASYCEGCRTGDLNRGRNGHKKPLVADPARAVTVSDSVAGYARIGSGRLPSKSAGGLFHEWG